MKQFLRPKRGDLIVVGVGLALLACAAFPAVLLADYVLTYAARRFGVDTVWTPLVAVCLVFSYACLIAWAAFSQSHCLRRCIAFAVLLGTGLGLMWLSAHLNQISNAYFFFGERVLEVVLLGAAGFPLLLTMKYLLGIQLLQGRQVARPPKLKLFLIGAAIFTCPAFIISAVAQQTRDANLQNVATIIVIGAFFVTCLIGIPVWILSRNWNRKLRALLLAVCFLLICALSTGLAILMEREQNIWLGGLFRGAVYANAALLLSFISVIFVGGVNRFRFVAMQRRGGRWQGAIESGMTQTPASLIRFSPASIVFSVLVVGGFLFFESRHDLPTFYLSRFGERFSNARFASELNRQYERVADNDDVADFLRNRPSPIQLNTKFGTIEQIAIRVDLPGADRLIEDLRTLGEIPKLCLNGPSPLEYDSSTWNPATLTSKQLAEMAKCKNLSSVSFFSVRIEDSAAENLQDVESVELVWTENTDELLEILAETNSLKDLTIRRTDLTERGLEKISSMTKLRKLEIDYDETIKPSSLRGISRLEQLEMLKLKTIDVDDDLIEEIAQLKNLQVLMLWTADSKISDRSADSLMAMPKLLTVELHGRALTTKAYGRLKSSAKFSIHDAVFENVLDGAIQDSFAKDWLEFSLEQHGGDLAAALEDTASKIERDSGNDIVELEFDDVWISDVGLEKLKELSQLRSLDLESSVYPNLSAGNKFEFSWRECFESPDLTAKAVLEFGSLMNLEILRLPSLLMDDAIFARLTKMPTLTEISFDPALVSDELYPNLANLPELTRIRLQSGRIESALIKQLQSMTQITEIVIVAPGKDGMARTYAEEARQKLSAALPGVNVQIELPGHSTEGFEHAERTD